MKLEGLHHAVRYYEVILTSCGKQQENDMKRGKI
jgi:hypothetical protein